MPDPIDWEFVRNELRVEYDVVIKGFASLAGTGLRCGEVFGLRMEDRDLTNRKIYVRRNIYKGREVSVKTKNANRVVHIEPMLAEMLRLHLDGRKSGLVFQTRMGTPFSKDNVRRKLHSILDDLGLKRGGLRAFRHGFPFLGKAA